MSRRISLFFQSVAVAAFALGASHATQAKKMVHVPAPAPAPAVVSKPLIDLPHLERELENGLKVIVVKTPGSGMVSLQIPMQTGSRNEVEPGKTGFAHFFEHMMFRGTPNNPPEKYEAAMKAAGADHNAYTDEDYTNYHVDFTKEDLEGILALEADRFKNLSFSEEQFRTEALAVKGEYLKNYSNPLNKGFEQLQNLAYTTHTYKHTGMGFLADIDNMPNQIDYAHTFFKRWYRPEYATVVVTGDVELEPTFELVKKYWADWQRGDFKIEVPAEPAQTEAKYAHIAWKGDTLPWLIVSWHAPKFSTSTPENAAMALLGEIYFSESSALYQKLVVKDQLVDSLAYDAPRTADPGLFVVAMQLTKAENAEAVVKALDDTLRTARTTRLAAETLAQTKSRFKYAYAAGLESPATTAGMLARFVRYERSFDTINNYFSNFDKVAPDDLTRSANLVFTDANRTAVSIAQGESLPGANSFAALDADVAKAGVSDAPAEAAPANDFSLFVDSSEDAEARKKNPFAAKDQVDTRLRMEAWAADEAKYTVKVLEQHSDSPLVDVSIIFQTGSARDPVGKKGLAALTAAMLAQGGSVRHDIESIQKALYPLAAGLDVQVDKELVKFSATVHRDNLDRWWDIVSEQLIDPGFRSDDFARLKLSQQNAIRVGLRGDNDEEFGKEALYEAIYGPNHAYGTLTAGKLKDLDSIKLGDLQEFWRSEFVRGRMMVGLAGDYDDKFHTKFLAAMMRLGQKEGARVDAKAPAVAAARQALVIEKNAPAVAVSFGIPLDVKRGDADWLALWLARSWLGEHRSSAGQLYQQIREQRGMNYGDYAYIEYFPAGMFRMRPEPNYARQNDLFQIWLRPLRNNNDAVFATRAALRQIELLASKGMRAEDFEQTRNFLKKNVAVLTAAQDKRLGYAIDSRIFKIADFVTYVREGLDKLTLEQVNDALRRRIKPEGFQFVFISADAADLAKRLGSGAPSPVKYNSEKPAALLAEDKIIASYPLKLKPTTVKVVKADTLFE